MKTLERALTERPKRRKKRDVVQMRNDWLRDLQEADQDIERYKEYLKMSDLCIDAALPLAGMPSVCIDKNEGFDIRDGWLDLLFDKMGWATGLEYLIADVNAISNKEQL